MFVWVQKKPSLLPKRRSKSNIILGILKSHKQKLILPFRRLKIKTFGLSFINPDVFSEIRSNKALCVTSGTRPQI